MKRFLRPDGLRLGVGNQEAHAHQRRARQRTDPGQPGRLQGHLARGFQGFEAAERIFSLQARHVGIAAAQHHGGLRAGHQPQRIRLPRRVQRGDGPQPRDQRKNRRQGRQRYRPPDRHRGKRPYKGGRAQQKHAHRSRKQAVQGPDKGALRPHAAFNRPQRAFQFSHARLLPFGALGLRTRRFSAASAVSSTDAAARNAILQYRKWSKGR